MSIELLMTIERLAPLLIQLSSARLCACACVCACSLALGGFCCRRPECRLAAALCFALRMSFSRYQRRLRSTRIELQRRPVVSERKVGSAALSPNETSAPAECSEPAARKRQSAPSVCVSCPLLLALALALALARSSNLLQRCLACLCAKRGKIIP